MCNQLYESQMDWVGSLFVCETDRDRENGSEREMTHGSAANTYDLAGHLIRPLQFTVPINTIKQCFSTTRFEYVFPNSPPLVARIHSKQASINNRCNWLNKRQSLSARVREKAEDSKEKRGRTNWRCMIESKWKQEDSETNGETEGERGMEYAVTRHQHIRHSYSFLYKDTLVLLTMLVSNQFTKYT